MDINLLINIVAPITALLLGYLFGSIPWGVIIGKVFFHKDPRDYGSGNSGGTNVGRLFGKKIGLLCTILDMTKAALAIYISWAIVTFIPTLHDAFYTFGRLDMISLTYWIAGLGAALGHCWSIFLHFKGGKAVSCLMGMSTMCSWLGFLTGFFYFAVLKLKKYVSLASIVAGGTQAIAAWTAAILDLCGVMDIHIFGWTFALGENGLKVGLWYAILVTIIWIILIFRHASNIDRLKAGNERKITWMK